jgi:hypothetical protein
VSTHCPVAVAWHRYTLHTLCRQPARLVWGLYLSPRLHARSDCAGALPVWHCSQHKHHKVCLLGVHLVRCG